MSNQFKPVQTGFGRLGVCYMYVARRFSTGLNRSMSRGEVG